MGLSSSKTTWNRSWDSLPMLSRFRRASSITQRWKCLFINPWIVLVGCIIDFKDVQVWLRVSSLNFNSYKVIKVFLIFFQAKFWITSTQFRRHWDSSRTLLNKLVHLWNRICSLLRWFSWFCHLHWEKEGIKLILAKKRILWRKVEKRWRKIKIAWAWGRL